MIEIGQNFKEVLFAVTIAAGFVGFWWAVTRG